MSETMIPQPAPLELMNRQEWHENAIEHVAYAHEHGTPLSALFADINFFKLVNDTLGHDVGDDVIDTTKLFVAELASVLRHGRDTISLTSPDFDNAEISDRLSPLEKAVNAYGGHLGGDEYGEIAETDEVGIQLVADRLRDKFNELVEKPEYAELKRLGVGLSIGKATLKPGMTASEFLRAADEDGYEDKVRQLPPLTEEQVGVLLRSKEEIEAQGMRIRDLIKYERYLNRISQDNSRQES